MTPYVPAASSLLNVPAYALALVGLALISLIAFALLVFVKMPNDSEWGELRFGKLVAQWRRKQQR